MMHTIILLAATAAALWLIRRDLVGFNAELRHGKWAIDGRHTLPEAYQAWKAKRANRRANRACVRDMRAHNRRVCAKARAATVEELGVGAGGKGWGG